jgi:hypothetical protein
MDVGAVGGWTWCEDVGGGRDHEGARAVGINAKARAEARQTVTIAVHQAISPESSLLAKR